jgi:glycosyltransferase involved in cell wall biosynthesis
MNSVAPLLSVIIPCYNRASIIAQAVDSVRGQTFQDWELVIVDDGSADNIAGALSRYLEEDPRIRLVGHLRNSGEPAARNTGIQTARGRFIAFLDSDDTWNPAKLERQVRAVLSDPDPDNVFCVTQTLVVLSETRRIVRPACGPAPNRSFAEFLYNDGGFAQSSSFFLAKSLAERFPFREDLRQMVDHVFFMEIGAAGARYLLVEEPLTVWHNEDRPDRISNGDDLAEWRTIITLFKQVTDPFVPPHVLVAAEARFLSGHLWREFPAESIRLLFRSWLGGALTASQVTKLFCRNAMPQRQYDFVRNWLTTLTAGQLRRRIVF